MTAAKQLFHNRYILEEIFSRAKPNKRYCDFCSGDDIAARGLLKLLQFKAGCNDFLYFSHRAMDLAAAHGHLETVQWLHTNRSESCTPAAMNWAAKNGHLETVQWLYTNCSEHCSTSTALNLAAMHGRLETVRWLHANGSEHCSARASLIAIQNNQIPTAEWLCANLKDCTSTSSLHVHPQPYFLQALLCNRMVPAG